MSKLLIQFNKTQIKSDLPDIRPGDTIRVHQKIKEGGKERIQDFEGLVIARKHGKGISAGITVRKIISGVGVEKVFPLHSPNIEKIEVLGRSSARRSKLYYLRTAKGAKSRLKKKEIKFSEAIATQEPKNEKTEEQPKQENK
jgi:large subunit ribosomal protein L19